MLYVLVFTFMVGASDVQDFKKYCSTMACVHQLERAAFHSTRLARLQVWRDDDYTPLAVSDVPLWPPLIDDQFQ